MGLAGFLGGTAGALVLLNTPQRTFLHLVPWLLLVAALIFAASGPVARWLERRKGSTDPAGAPRQLPVFLCTIVVCFYIGYFGAGAGFLIITLLSLFGFQDLNEINALKVVSTTMANGIAFVLFVVNGEVVWRYCLLAMVTAAIGGYTSASMARRVPQRVLRGIRCMHRLGNGGVVFLETVREAGNSEIERQGSVIETMLFDFAPRGYLEWIGSMAAVCTTVSFVPQLHPRVAAQERTRHFV